MVHNRHIWTYGVGMKLAVKCINTECNNAEDNESHPRFIVELQNEVEIRMDYIVSPNSIRVLRC